MLSIHIARLICLYPGDLQFYENAYEKTNDECYDDTVQSQPMLRGNLWHAECRDVIFGLQIFRPTKTTF